MSLYDLYNNYERRMILIEAVRESKMNKKFIEEDYNYLLENLPYFFNKDLIPSGCDNITNYHEDEAQKIYKILKLHFPEWDNNGFIIRASLIREIDNKYNSLTGKERREEIEF